MVMSVSSFVMEIWMILMMMILMMIMIIRMIAIRHADEYTCSWIPAGA